MARVGFLGTGTIAACMVRGIAGGGHEIAVSERNAETAAALAAEVPGLAVLPNREVVARSEIVVACLMADVARAVLPALPFRPDHRVVSVMADLPLAELRTLCAPADEIALTIPMPMIAGGGCPLPVHPDSRAVETLFGARNVVLPVPSEDALNAHFAACALAAPLLSQMQAGADWLAGVTGEPAKAEAYVAALFAGFFGQMPLDGAGRFRALLDALGTEGGFNATLRERMRGAQSELVAGLDAFRPRLGLGERADG